MMTKLDKLGKAIIDRIALEWQRQGHQLTGAFEQSLEYDYDGEYLNIYGNHYGKILETGVTAANIPYTPGSGATSSKYIQGLARYAMLRMGVDERTALSIAFAIARTHKREGMPTRASAVYSQTGRRTGFVEDSVPDIDQLVEEFTDKLVFS